jgi:hypothetical protein
MLRPGTKAVWVLSMTLVMAGPNLRAITFATTLTSQLSSVIGL